MTDFKLKLKTPRYQKVCQFAAVRQQFLVQFETVFFSSKESSLVLRSSTAVVLFVLTGARAHPPAPPPYIAFSSATSKRVSLVHLP
jgi:hypothetical protein